MTEIERRFRVAELPAEIGDGTRIRQAYVAIETTATPVTVRVRERSGSFTIGVKQGAGLERAEIEWAIEEAVFDQLWAVAGARTIEKRRHDVPLGSLVAEVDVFAGRLAGLSLVEVEFPDRAAAEAFDPPSWFGEDLTDAEGWTNAELSQRPASD